MAELYTACVINVNGAAGCNGTYTVPEGYRFIARDLAGFCFGDTETGILVGTDLSTSAVWLFANYGTEQEPIHWQGRQAFDASTEFQVEVFGGGQCSARLTGYLLTL